MNPTVQLWMPAILALSSGLMVVAITAWLNTKALSAQIEGVRAEIAALRAEMRQQMAELELRMMKEFFELRSRVERLEDQRGLILQP